MYALTHNETSTGVAMQLRRPAGADPGSMVAVDATSGAGGLRLGAGRGRRVLLRAAEVLRGRRWPLARRLLPGGVERIERIAASDRWRPASIDLGIALTNSRADQTYNTPAVATLVLLAEQLDWMNANGGLEWCASRSDRSAAIMYGWAESRDWATPFVTDPAKRSSVVATIDLDDSISADDGLQVLRANGIYDTDSYRKLGRNQLRVGMFPAIDPTTSRP